MTLKRKKKTNSKYIQWLGVLGWNGSWTVLVCVWNWIHSMCKTFINGRNDHFFRSANAGLSLKGITLSVLQTRECFANGKSSLVHSAVTLHSPWKRPTPGAPAQAMWDPYFWWTEVHSFGPRRSSQMSFPTHPRESSISWEARKLWQFFPDSGICELFHPHPAVVTDYRFQNSSLEPMTVKYHNNPPSVHAKETSCHHCCIFNIRIIAGS